MKSRFLGWVVVGLVGVVLAALVGLTMVRGMASSSAAQTTATTVPEAHSEPVAVAEALAELPQLDAESGAAPQLDAAPRAELPVMAAPLQDDPAPAATSMPEATATVGPPATPTPRPEGTAPRVGVQVGHWKANELPDELQRLRTSTGTAAGGFTEVQVNLDIGQRVADMLRVEGFEVDLLPATIPPGYDADAFVSIHADGVQSSGPRGFKLATPWRTSQASQHLMDTITAEYADATALPQDDAITFNMKGYYAFNYFRNNYAVARTTPAVIVEMGFLTNPTDRAMITRQPDRIASGIARGVTRYLRERDPNNGAALLPPEFKPQRAIDPDGINVYSAPRDNAKIIGRFSGERRMTPIQERDGWFQVFGRSGEQRIIGWIRKDQVVETTGPTPTPPPPTG